jgi:hypothetical protein
MSKRPYPKWEPRHEAVLQWLLSHTSGKLYECARDTGYSRWQVSRIVNSPHFQAVYREAIEAQRQKVFRQYCERLMGRDFSKLL